MIIKRDYYLNRLIAAKHSNVIKIVTELRRCYGSGRACRLIRCQCVVALFAYSVFAAADVVINEIQVANIDQYIDPSFVSISAADCSWTDSLVYSSQARWQTFGRYPDGSNNTSLFDRITIGQNNKINTTTQLVRTEDNGNANPIYGIKEDVKEGNLVEVRYYNLRGQRIKNPAGELIVIQREYYDNGTCRARKLLSNQ